MTAAKQLLRRRRRPCEKCRRRHRRILLSTAVISSIVGGVPALILLYPGGPSASLDAATIHYSTKATASVDPLDQNQQIQRITQAFKLHATKVAARPSSTVAVYPTQTHTPSPSYTSPSPSYVSPTPTYTPTPTITPSQTYTTEAATVPSSSIGLEVLAKAETMQGVPYVWAGDTPSGFDCSGLVYWAANQLGINMPRDTYDMLGQGVASGILVQTYNPQPGDLAFFGSGHVEFVTSTPNTTFGAQQAGTNVGFNKYNPPYYVPTEFFRIT
jgi:cell wall-associated NlpC family hydrolase